MQRSHSSLFHLARSYLYHSNSKLIQRLHPSSASYQNVPVCQIHISKGLATENELSCNEKDYYDVVIVGGGMVGLAMACALNPKRPAQLPLPSFKHKLHNFAQQAKLNQPVYNTELRSGHRVSTVCFNGVDYVGLPQKSVKAAEHSAAHTCLYNIGQVADAPVMPKKDATMKILVLESAKKHAVKFKEDYTNSKNTFDKRVYAINPSSETLFRKLAKNGKGGNAFEYMEKRRIQRVKSMHIWERQGGGAISFGNKTEETIAHIIEHSVIMDALTLAADYTEDVTVKYGCKIDSLDLPQSFHTSGANQLASLQVKQANGSSGEETIQTVKTKLVIGADGFNSFVRKEADLPTVSHDYKQTAVVATLKVKNAEKDGCLTAWQRYLTSGPVALLPLSATQSSLVWSTGNDHAKYLLELSEDDFVEQLNSAIHDTQNNHLTSSNGFNWLMQKAMTTLSPGSYASSRLRQPPRVLEMVSDSRAAFPLHSSFTTKVAVPRAVLIGDAAHRVHPQAGQGVNLGFGDVEVLARVIREAASFGEDIGDLSHLLQYETERQRATAPMVAGIHGINAIFSEQFPPFQLARNLGLSVLNSLPPIKNQISSLASGGHA